MKVLHIIQRYPPAIGGAEVWCRNVCRYLASRGVESRVACINLHNMEEFFRELSESERFVALDSHDMDGTVPIRRYRLSSLARRGPLKRVLNFILYKTPLSRCELAFIIRHSPHSLEMYSHLFQDIAAADLVHLHTLPYFHTLVGYWIARLFGKKTVITPHFHPGNPFYEKKIFYRMLSRCDAVISVSAYEKTYLAEKSVPAHKIHVTGNSILPADLVDEAGFERYRSALLRSHRIPATAKKIVFIGRKEPYKGIGDLIAAAGQLACREMKHGVCLFLVGSPTSAFDKEFGSIAVPPGVTMIDFGVVSDKEKDYLLKLSDVLVLPSEFEAFGIVFLEAWRHAKPVIGSDRGAIPEVLQGAGICVEYGNVNALAAAISRVLHDQALASSLGRAGKHKLDTEYSYGTIGEKVFGVYRDLIRRPKTVLVVSHLFPPYFTGGSEIVAYYQSRRLREMGFDIKVFAGRLESRRKRYAVTREKGLFDITRINLHHRDFDCYSVNFDKPALQSEFRKTLDAMRPDVVHFHNIYPFSVLMIDECVRAGIPTLMTLHDYWGICFKNILLTDDRKLCDKKDASCSRCKENFFSDESCSFSLEERNRVFMEHLNKVDMLMAPSKFLLERFRQAGALPDRSCLVKYGIDTAAFAGFQKIGAEKVRFGWIGQIAEHKGTDILLRAVAALSAQERAGISVTIVGSGEDVFVGYCKRLAKELGLDECVRFAGKVSNDRIVEVYRQIDALIVTSIWFENSPVVILEALATGTPVLGSDIGGIPEFLEDGVTGFLHRHDDPEALSRNMRKVIRNPRVLDEMRGACISKAQENDLSATVKVIAGYYGLFSVRTPVIKGGNA